MIKVLFVCLGNICRSPLAQGVFEDLLRNNNLQDKVECDSAGIIGYHSGSLADPRTRKESLRRGIELTHKARQFSISDFEKFDIIVAMDNENFENIIGKKPSAKEYEIKMFRMFDKFNEGSTIVPDPYYGDEKEFVEVHNIIERCCAGFLEYLISKYNLKSS